MTESGTLSLSQDRTALRQILISEESTFKKPSDLWFALLLSQLSRGKKHLPLHIQGTVQFTILNGEREKSFYLLINGASSQMCVGKVKADMADCQVITSEVEVDRIIFEPHNSSGALRITGRVQLFIDYLDFTRRTAFC